MQESLWDYGTQLRTCSEVLSRSLTSDRSESLAVTAINIQKEVQESSIVLSTATEKTTSGFLQQLHRSKCPRHSWIKF